MGTLADLSTRVERDEETGCLRWTGAHANGYGHISLDGRQRLVHRVAYEQAYGAIPEGLHVDHVWDRGCRHRDCIEPSHLEAVTLAENNRRAKAKITHCRQGHPFDEANTHLSARGKRECRTCKRDYMRRRRVTAFGEPTL